MVYLWHMTKSEKPVQRPKARGADITGNLRDKRHGTYAGYNYNGCTCSKCREANRIYITAKQAEYASKPTPEHLHGTYNGYNNYKCRCDRCRAASAEKLRLARSRKNGGSLRSRIKFGEPPASNRPARKVATPPKQEVMEQPMAEPVMERAVKTEAKTKPTKRPTPIQLIPEELREYWISPWAQHGEVSGYRYWGCRCDLCRKAHNDYQNEWYAKNKKKK